VLLIGYELFLGSRTGAALPRPKKDAEPPSAIEREALFEQIDAALRAIDFYKGKNPEAIMRTVRAVLRRTELNTRETALVRAMLIETQKMLGVTPFRDALMRK
jgi:tRNA C32,U32 (ribose-2'-O)-methylase TrmJ